MAGNTVILRFLGEDSDLRRTISGLGTALGGIGKGTAIVAGLGAASSAAVASIAAIPLAFGGIGIAAAAQSQEVKDSFTGLADHVKAEVTKMSAPFVPVLQKIANQTRTTFDQLAPSLGQMFAAAAPMVQQLAGGLLMLIKNIMPGFQAAFNAAGPLIDAIARGLGTLGTGLSGFIEGLARGAPGAAQGLGAIFDVIGALLPVVGQLLGALAGALGPVLAALAPVFIVLANAIGDILTPLINALAPVLLIVANALAGALIPAVQQISASFTALMPVLTPIIEQIGGLLVQAIQILTPLLPPLIKAFFDIVAALLPLIPPLLQIASDLLPLLGDVLGVVVAIITNVVVPVIRALASVLGFLLGVVSTVVGGIADGWSWLKDRMTESVQWIIRKVGEVQDWMRNLGPNVKAAVGNLGTLLVNAGRDLLTGLWNGIMAMGPWLQSKITNFFAGLVPDWARDALGIGSPSKVFAEIGKWVPEGMAKGITGNADVVQQSVNGMASVSVPTGATAPAAATTGGSGGLAVRFEGNTSDALATVIMGLIRQGKIQLVNA